MRDVVAGVGLGDGERDVQLAADHLGQITQLLLLAAVKDEGAYAEDGEVDRAGCGHRTARRRHLAHYEGGLGDSKSAAAVALRNGDAEVAGSGNRGKEIMGKFGTAIVVAPIFVREVAAEGADLPDDLFLGTRLIQSSSS